MVQQKIWFKSYPPPAYSNVVMEKWGESEGAKSTLFFDEQDITVPQNIYLKWVRQELEDEEACLELPFMILVLVSFTLMAVLSLNQHVVLSVEQAIEQDIRENANFAFNEYMGHKTLQDVHSVPDFWSWMRLGFLPLVIQPAWMYSEGYARNVASAFQLNTVPNSVWDMGTYHIPVAGDYLHYNRIIGGLRFRQQVAPEAPCRFPPGRKTDLWERWYGKVCMPAFQEPFFEPDTSVGEVFEQATREEWLLMADMQRMMDQVLDMEDGCHGVHTIGTRACYCNWCQAQSPAMPWVTERTQRIEVSMATFNAEYGLLTLTGVNLWIARGGRMRKRVELMSVWVNFSQFTAANVPVMVFAGIWLVCVCYIFINEIIEIISVIRNAETRWHRALLEDYLGFWNIVDWLSISVAAVVVVLWFGLAMESGTLQDHLGKLLEDRSSLALVAAFFQALEVTSAEEKRFRLILCFYPMLLLLRLFKSFAAQPRLAVVTDTIKLASQDLLHFGLVSAAVIACLCLNAVLLFGRDVEAFGNLPRSLHSSFRMLFGDWEWAPMEEVSRSGAYLWFTIFMVLVAIILLNMLLAIILDNYMDVKRVSASAQSLGEQKLG